MTDTKRCSQCGQERNLSEFYKQRRAESVYRSTCKSCDSARSAKYRATKQPNASLTTCANAGCQAPRLGYVPYCRECHNAYARKMYRLKGGKEYRRERRAALERGWAGDEKGRGTVDKG